MIDVEAFIANPDDRRHGSPYGYRLGCRCDRCKEAHRIENNRYRQSEAYKKWRAHRLAKLQNNPNDPLHGKNAGYNLGCRCPKCKLAHKVYFAKLQMKKGN